MRDAGLSTKLSSTFGENIESAELHLVVMLAGVQRIEIRDAVDAEHDRFTIEHEALLAHLARSLDDPRIAIGPVVAAARDQTRAIAVALQAEAVAVVFYFMKPVGPFGTAMPFIGRQISK